MNTTYSIKYWIDEASRDLGLSYILVETDSNESELFIDPIKAIEVATESCSDQQWACVEVISSNEDEGDYGVIYHISNDGEIFSNK